MRLALGENGGNVGMAKVNIIDLLDGRWEDGTRPADIFSIYVSRDPENYVEDIVKGLSSGNRRVQSGCAELASLLSEAEPSLLYDNLGLFQENLGAKELVLRWEAVCTLGNLVSVDKDQMIRENVEQIANFLNDKSIVLQVHAVRALTKIAQAFPDLSGRIFERLLRSKEKFPGNRIGYLIEATAAFAGKENLVPKIRRFIVPYAKSDFKSVAVKARRVLRKLPAK